jgi:L-cysteine S-thiosulfotransferase
MYKRTLGLAALALVAGVAAHAADLPSNILYDANTDKKTLWPQPVANSGALKYNEHRQDLSKWPTLSYEDKRSTRRPETVELKGDLNGDAKRGKEIAMNTQRGNCWACHVLPGDPQGGTGGPTLVGFKHRGYPDAFVYQTIWDRRIVNPGAIMPPYGTNGVLPEQDIRDLVAFLQSLD